MGEQVEQYEMERFVAYPNVILAGNSDKNIVKEDMNSYSSEDSISLLQHSHHTEPHPYNGIVTYIHQIIRSHRRDVPNCSIEKRKGACDLQLALFWVTSSNTILYLAYFISFTCNAFIFHYTRLLTYNFFLTTFLDNNLTNL